LRQASIDFQQTFKWLVDTLVFGCCNNNFKLRLIKFSYLLTAQSSRPGRVILFFTNLQVSDNECNTSDQWKFCTAVKASRAIKLTQVMHITQVDKCY